jgi:hypothetical protein
MINRTTGNSVLKMRRSVRITVDKSSSHHLSQSEIPSDNRLGGTDFDGLFHDRRGPKLKGERGISLETADRTF